MLEFGKYDYFCDKVQMAVCLLVGDSPLGIKPSCYARNIEIAGSIIFQAGRREMIMVFYLYLAVNLLDILTISGFISFASSAYPYFVAGYLALTTTMCWCLMLNGFVGFQWAEDGTYTSLWTFRVTSAIVFGVMYFVSIATFKDAVSLKRTDPVGIFTIYFIFNLLFLLIYVVSQIILVVNTLDEYWPLGNICFAVVFFAAGQVIQLFLSSKICTAIKHYVDGLFFGTICTLLSVMMIYKYWDSITKEDLEFSVGGKGNVWEVKDYINPDDEFAPYAGQVNNGMYQDNSSNYQDQYMNNSQNEYGVYNNDMPRGNNQQYNY
ncbi:Chitin synthase export chaperone [Smittium mucronatum]|uniref:Chitin synthase export chaperone n=1 Tax=Smittium mucronatum TaxID=133383 RepID=A0A1R0H5E4_9FUNG|nr:Chitin synthase export chaperone [Smittium mucronatum]